MGCFWFRFKDQGWSQIGIRTQRYVNPTLVQLDQSTTQGKWIFSLPFWLKPLLYWRNLFNNISNVSVRGPITCFFVGHKRGLLGKNQHAALCASGVTVRPLLTKIPAKLFGVAASTNRGHMKKASSAELRVRGDATDHLDCGKSSGVRVCSLWELR